MDNIPVLLACTRQKADGVVVHVSNPEEAQRLGCVRVLDKKALRLFVSDWRAFGKEYGHISRREELRLRGLLQLAEAIRNQDESAGRWASESLASDPEPQLRKLKQRILRQQPGVELARVLAEGLRGVQLVLWWKEEGRDLVALPGLRCPDVLSALYTLALVRILGGTGFGTCVMCGKAFVRQRGERKKTCSDKCRYALFQLRRRTKKSRKRRKER